MAKLAILLYEEAPEREQVLLARTLDFFGVPWKMLALSTFSEGAAVEEDSVVFGSAACIADALEHEGTIKRCLKRSTVFYSYSDPDRAAAQQGIRSLLGSSCVKLHDATDGIVRVEVSSGSGAHAGPMAGIRASLHMRTEDASLVGLEKLEAKAEAIISADGSPIYVRFWKANIAIYLCLSSYIVDIDEEVGAGFYDIKAHFCSVVPLVSFIKFMFREVAWQPQELGACLIIDDPLLKTRYGACDFRLLRNLMQQYGFTTNIAFIPWNWWRTSRSARELFGSGSGSFSISIHGCDHTNSEFGDSSPVVLGSRAKLAQIRMTQHEARTGIHHDPVMVFPQGAFSSKCPKILKHSGFIAAVNTEISPVDRNAGSTRIRDVWDIAIMKYGGFPLFTRRYAHHGLENFTFDLLLGKPCLIVAHHEFFRDDSIALIQLIQALQNQTSALRWAPLGTLLRRACRRRVTASDTEEVEMYGLELQLDNTSNRPIHVNIGRRETDPKSIAQIQYDGTPIPWNIVSSSCTFEVKVDPLGTHEFHIHYQELPNAEMTVQSILFKSRVFTRRLLSELRDAHIGARRI